MRPLFPLLIFYKHFIFWSFGINTFFTLIGFPLIIILLIKLLSILFLHHIIRESKWSRLIALIKSDTLSTLKLFGLVMLLDIGASLPFLVLLREFV